jgi:signal transduction histidine kinase/methylmalonyl-CoA mutase cobalamin-binding subunit
MRIIAVDDDEFALSVLIHALVQAGHEPVGAHNGREALELLRQGASRMVVSDWVMPEMDGPELCQRIRNEAFDAYIYVILLTSKDTLSDLVQGLSAGADDFITKPFDPQELRARVQTGERVLSLETRTSAAEAANRAKSEFLANMSHEIRTPMTAILGFADTLEESELSEQERRDALEAIRRNGAHLLAIINDILDLSKIEADQVTCETIRYSPCELLADVVSMMGVQTRSAGLEFVVEHAGPVPRALQGDPTRLRQILVNLVGNAIKFTKRGQVRLVSRCERCPANDGWLHLDVIDTGIGMTPDQAACVFQPFVQADTSMTRKYGGTGLGLTICKRLAQLMHGDIVIVDTKPGVGTHVRLSIPTGPLNDVELVNCRGSPVIVSAEPDQVKSGASVGVLACRILLAEDGPDNQRIIAHVLRKAGAEVTIVEHGQAAVEAATAAATSGNPFDVILMDMQMPVMDGYEATARLRAQGYDGIIVALTAHALAQDRQKCVEAGCNDYATKPIKRNELLGLIRKYLPDASERPAVEEDVRTGMEPAPCDRHGSANCVGGRVAAAVPEGQRGLVPERAVR